jgi:outer membrane lipoprotein LolB
VARPVFTGLLALLAVALAACTSLPRGPGGQALTPDQLEAFQLAGSIGLRVQKESFPGRVRWTHEAARDELWFYSPVGTTVAHLVQTPDGALLVNSKGEEFRAASLESLAADVLGWDLPLQGLPYWVRGVPWPAGSDEARIQRDERGRIVSLQQAGWTVTYLAWFGDAANALPARIDVVGERLSLRLAVQRWELAGAR